MIKFYPSKRIIKETELDFDLLGRICTNIFERGFDQKINIECAVRLDVFSISAVLKYLM